MEVLSKNFDANLVLCFTLSEVEEPHPFHYSTVAPAAFPDGHEGEVRALRRHPTRPPSVQTPRDPSGLGDDTRRFETPRRFSNLDPYIK